jgi:ABC-type sulfate/molybdate transport systems ATPase subunit
MTGSPDKLYDYIAAPMRVCVEDVLIAYDQAANANGASFSLAVKRHEIASGAIHALYGTNGSGKTSYLRALARVLSPQRGRIHWFPDKLLDHGSHLLFVPTTGPMPHWTVWENVTAACMAHPDKRNEITERAKALIEVFGLAKLEQRFPHQLSTGQQQRTVLARALAGSPQALLTDEILSGQSEFWADRIAEHLAGFASRGRMVFLVTHDPDWVTTYAARVTHIVSEASDAVHASSFFIGFDGPTADWAAYRQSRLAAVSSKP